MSKGDLTTGKIEEKAARAASGKESAVILKGRKYRREGKSGKELEGRPLKDNQGVCRLRRGRPIDERRLFEKKASNADQRHHSGEKRGEKESQESTLLKGGGFEKKFSLIRARKKKSL